MTFKHESQGGDELHLPTWLRLVYVVPYFMVTNLNLPAPIPGASRQGSNRANGALVLTLFWINAILAGLTLLGKLSQSHLPDSIWLPLGIAAVCYIAQSVAITPRRFSDWKAVYSETGWPTRLAYASLFVALLASLAAYYMSAR